MTTTTVASDAERPVDQAAGNPVTKAPHYARAVFKTGLLTDAEDYFSNKVATAKVAGLTMDHAGKNAHTYLSNWKGP